MPGPDAGFDIEVWMFIYSLFKFNWFSSFPSSKLSRYPLQSNCRVRQVLGQETNMGLKIGVEMWREDAL